MPPTSSSPSAEPMTKSRVTAFYTSTPSEQSRLHAQHAIGISAFANVLLLFPAAPTLLSTPHLRILDNAGADGFWLRELRGQLAHPESAELVCADLAPYPAEGDTDGVRLVRQDMMEPWPREWEGTFDLVHQKTCLSFHPTWASAVASTARLLRLLKPGGYIQLVDAAPPYGPIEAGDPPHARFFKSIGRAASAADKENGIDPPIPTRLPELLAEAVAAAEGVELEHVGTRMAEARWGKGAESEELEQVGFGAMEELVNNMEALWERTPEVRRVGVEEWEGLKGEVVREVRERGFGIEVAAAWGRRGA